MGPVTDEGPLDEADVDAHPMTQFGRWFADAEAAEVPDADAMCLSSVSADGWPSARMVLLKELDEQGFVFYTNYDSPKGVELAAEPRVALVFRWHRLERQVRVTGRAERVSPAQSDAYFDTRPRGAQIGAWASPQSQVLASREELEAAVAEVEERFGDGPIGRPSWWGGFRVVPETVELWQGRPDRLHDRLRYRPASEGGGWRLERLAP